MNRYLDAVDSGVEGYGRMKIGMLGRVMVNFNNPLAQANDPDKIMTR